LGINENVIIKDANSENESKSSEKGEPKKGGDTFLERAKKYIGPWGMAAMNTATIGLTLQGGLGIGGVKGFSMPESPGSALALRGSDNSTGLTPPFPNQRTWFIGNSQSERSVPSDKGYKEKNPSWHFDQREAQGTSGGETFQEDREKVEGFPVGKRTRVARRQEARSDIRSRKVTPRRESMRKNPSCQLERSEGKGRETLELGKGVIADFDSLEENKAIQKGFQEMLKDEELSKEMIHSLEAFMGFLKGNTKNQKEIIKLIEDKEVIEGIKDIFGNEELKKEIIYSIGAFMKSLKENKRAKEEIIKLIEDEKAMEGIKNLLKYEELREGMIYFLEDFMESRKEDEKALDKFIQVLEDERKMEYIKTLLKDEELMMDVFFATGDEERLVLTVLGIALIGWGISRSVKESKKVGREGRLAEREGELAEREGELAEREGELAEREIGLAEREEGVRRRRMQAESLDSRWGTGSFSEL
jgi:hypothetical protein